MKTLSNISKKFIHGTLVILLASLFFACQEDPLVPDLNDTTLRSETVELDVPMTGTLEHGALYEIVLPEYWNMLPDKVLVVYAHGMVDPLPYAPLSLPSDSIAEKAVKDIVLAMGGYASTSYRDNGLVVIDAIEDIKNLVDKIDAFFTSHPMLFPPDYIFLGGPSEGGLVTALTIEKYPDLFDGAISICGPIGSFFNQLQYNGDFHVLFNYFFKKEVARAGINLGDPRVGVNHRVMQAWTDKILQLKLQTILQANSAKIPELITVSKATVDMSDPLSVGTGILELLRFNIMLTNDVIDRLDGIPYNNKDTEYFGSTNDLWLNKKVQRIWHPSFSRTLINLDSYETTGDISIPMVSIHTTGDHITPFWHHTLYGLKITANGNDLLYTAIPVPAYGHCTITEAHIQAALGILLEKCKALEL